MALSIPSGVGAEVSVPDVARSNRQGGAKVRDDVLPAAWMRDRGNEFTANAGLDQLRNGGPAMGWPHRPPSNLKWKGPHHQRYAA